MKISDMDKQHLAKRFGDAKDGTAAREKHFALLTNTADDLLKQQQKIAAEENAQKEMKRAGQKVARARREELDRMRSAYMQSDDYMDQAVMHAVANLGMNDITKGRLLQAAVLKDKYPEAALAVQPAR